MMSGGPGARALTGPTGRTNSSGVGTRACLHEPPPAAGQQLSTYNRAQRVAKTGKLGGTSQQRCQQRARGKRIAHMYSSQHWGCRTVARKERR